MRLIIRGVCDAVRKADGPRQDRARMPHTAHTGALQALRHTGFGATHQAGTWTRERGRYTGHTGTFRTLGDSFRTFRGVHTDSWPTHRPTLAEWKLNGHYLDMTCNLTFTFDAQNTQPPAVAQAVKVMLEQLLPLDGNSSVMFHA